MEEPLSQVHENRIDYLDNRNTLSENRSNLSIDQNELPEIPDIGTNHTVIRIKKEMSQKVQKPVTPTVLKTDPEPPKESPGQVTVLYDCPICDRKFLTEEFTKSHLLDFHRFTEEKLKLLGIKIITATLL